MSKKKCFVIMPFSKTSDQHDEEYWTIFFEEIIKPKMEKHDYSCERSKAKPDSITDSIIHNLKDADLVLAILTDHNPNVWYELGIRHTLRPNTILLIEKSQQLPSDIQQYGAILYNDIKLGTDRFDKDLEYFIYELKNDKPDNPVLKALGIPTYDDSSKTIESNDKENITETDNNDKLMLFENPFRINNSEKNHKIIDSHFILSTEGTVAFWVYIDSNITRPGNHYIVSHDTNKGDTTEKGGNYGYPNEFMFGHLDKTWHFGITDDNINPSAIRVENVLEHGWHHFVIRWKKEGNSFAELLINNKNSGKITDLRPWPTNHSNNLFIGTWSNALDEYYINTYLYRFIALSKLVDDSWVQEELNKKPTFVPD
jgi:hypothetical protein